MLDVIFESQSDRGIKRQVFHDGAIGNRESLDIVRIR